MRASLIVGALFAALALLACGGSSRAKSDATSW
jgi:hypothetical protein